MGKVYITGKELVLYSEKYQTPKIPVWEISSMVTGPSNPNLGMQ